MKSFWTILLLPSNVLMTLAWCGHLRFKDFSWGKGLGLASVILIRWCMAIFEYVLPVRADRLGHVSHGGPSGPAQLKVIQEGITLVVFAAFTLLAFKNEVLRRNHLVAGILLIMALWFVFNK